jgi:siroheme synthase (precorrin-2 oxidase/ferrochelatase)
MHVPLSLDVAGRPVLVVGDGDAAARRASALGDAGAIVTRRPSADYVAGEARSYWLVITAADDAAVNEVVFEDAEASGVWCNSVDDPAHCSFLFPAVARRGAVTVAVSTGGQSPALAAWLRDRLDEHLGPELAEVALRLADERRRIHVAGGSTAGIDWDARMRRYLTRAQAGASASSKR